MHFISSLLVRIGPNDQENAVRRTGNLLQYVIRFLIQDSHARSKRRYTGYPLRKLPSRATVSGNWYPCRIQESAGYVSTWYLVQGILSSVCLFVYLPPSYRVPPWAIVSLKSIDLIGLDVMFSHFRSHVIPQSLILLFDSYASVQKKLEYGCTLGTRGPRRVGAGEGERSLWYPG